MAYKIFLSELNLTQGGHRIAVVAKGMNKNPSNTSNSVNMFEDVPIRLNPPTLNVYDLGSKTLAILAPLEAEIGYDVIVDGNYVGHTNSVSFNLSGIGLASGSHQVQARAMASQFGGYAHSLLSAKVTFTI